MNRTRNQQRGLKWSGILSVALLASVAIAQEESDSTDKVWVPTTGQSFTMNYSSPTPVIPLDDATSRTVRIMLTPSSLTDSDTCLNESTCEPESGVSIVVPDSSRNCRAMTEPITFEYTYTTPGVKQLKMSMPNGLGLCAQWHPIIESTQTFTFVVGPAYDYPMTVTVDYPTGTPPMVVKATLNRFPTGYTGKFIWKDSSNPDAPVFEFTSGQLTATQTFREVGSFNYSLTNHGEKLIAGANYITPLGNTFNVAVSPTAGGKPYLLSNTLLTPLNTPGNEYNARLSSDELRIYYITDWQGRSELRQARRTSITAPFSDVVPLLFDGDKPSNHFGGLLNFEMPDDESAILLDVQEGARRRLILAPRIGNDGHGGPIFGLPNTIQAKRVEPWTGNRVSFGLEDLGNLGSNGASFLLPAIQQSIANGHLAQFNAVVGTPTAFSCTFPTTIYTDQLPRLLSNDDRIRYWVWNGVAHGAADLSPEESVFTKYGAAIAAERYSITGLTATAGTLIGLGYTGGDGSRLYHHSVLPDGVTGFDLYQAEFLLPPGKAAARSELTSHLTHRNPKPNATVLDSNADVVVDVGDLP